MKRACISEAGYFTRPEMGIDTFELFFLTRLIRAIFSLTILVFKAL